MASRIKRLSAKGLKRNTIKFSVNSNQNELIEISNPFIEFKWRIVAKTELRKRVSNAYSATLADV